MRAAHFAILGSVLFLASLTNAQSCDSLGTEFACGQSAACQFVNGLCKCRSEVKLDILFNVDTSGSIGYDGFQIQKQFITTLVTQGIANSSRIGFYMFAATVNASKGIQEWDDDELEDYTKGLYWSTGWTNTPAVLQASITQFDATFDQDRQQVLMMITDGNPCLPEAQGGCPQSVCNFAAQVKLAGIRVIIIGVGDGLNTKYVQCLTQSDEDFIPVASFSTSDFDSIMGSLSGVLCPVTKEAKFTEIKAAKKDDGWGYRWSRFVEVYNTGIDFSIAEISLGGLITMVVGAGPDITLSQGQYVVFYDAADDSIITASSVLTCHLCGSTCDLDSCTFAGETNAGYCWCENSLYVACRNTGDGNTCASGALSDINGESASDACSVCTFDDDMGRSNWDIVMGDGGDDPIDTVTYDATTWIITDDGFSYELVSKGFDNDVGTNWAQSCSVFGTPGSDPSATCTEGCTSDGCGSGNSCSTDTNLCVCNTDSGYYPQCTTPQSCTKCAQVYPPDVCVVTWTKNGTDRLATYEWEANTNTGDSEFYYRISYFSGSQNGGTVSTTRPAKYDQTTINPRLIATIYATDDYWNNNKTHGGFVETVKEVCTGDNEDLCQEYFSQKTWCTVITPKPSLAPTKEPTTSPTPAPSPMPTASPIQACPQVWWQNDDVCNPDDVGLRCNCVNDDGVDSIPDGDECCLLEPEMDLDDDGNAVYDEDRQHRPSDDCKLDAELQNPDERADGIAAAGTSAGYLLEERDHGFSFGIGPTAYPFALNICWALTFDEVRCQIDENSAENTVLCDEDNTELYSVGLNVSQTSGCVEVQGAEDEAAAVVEFTVTGLTCSEAEVALGMTDSGETGRTCFDNTAIYGSLKIVSVVSEQNRSCFDARVYPMEIPVWYNYADAFVAAPTQEEEIPAWLWWLIGALAVFLAILALLLYKFWWKNKATGAALGAVQTDLDAAIEENEMGFGGGVGGNAVGFNPLATGFNPNAPAGAAGPNGPLGGQGGGGDFVRPNVEKEVFRQEYGQNMGNNR